ncbi:beclin 1-associated autophagy-related key regulator-like isoform X3 [Limulus polyphemus]|uniref:Beclin 1-associated autophagy-related key regulator-like isoform X3 n=1 Tax=Limulus polyphemus TaxID=6850 RepID=A0ABM1TMD9_LIMPO|nr:beclin 1-associated autophagy-related key regulator-like isoform X3 [Limulus polyphemus]
MAASSSSNDSSSAPTDFYLSSSLSSNNGRGSVFGGEKCPLCFHSKRAFFCQDCIRNGDFTHSKSRYPERYAEKKLKLFKGSQEKSVLLESCKDRFSSQSRFRHLASKKQQILRRIELLELSLKENKEILQAEKSKFQTHVEDIQNLTNKVPKYKEKLQKIWRYISHCQNTTEAQRELLQSVTTNLKSVVRENVSQLTTWIFPVKEIDSRQISQDKLLDCMTVGLYETVGPVADLAEAQQTTYVKGKWIYTDDNWDLQYQIVKSCLNGNGDYSAYSVWVTQHKESVPSGSGESCLRNPGYNIAAALTHLTQLVSVLAFYLNQQLPQNLCYSEFCSHELTEEQFAHKVAKLNANVLHLCLSQNIDSKLLSPRQTIPNLLLLLDPNASDLGRCGVYEISTQLLDSVEKSLEKDLQLTEEHTMGTEDADFAGEWETVSELPAIEETHPIHHPDATTSIAGGLMSSAAASVASLWRAATGQK